MCSREEVRLEIASNNKVRDKQLFKVRDEILAEIKKIEKRQDDVRKDCEIREREVSTVKSYFNDHTATNKKDFESLGMKIDKMMEIINDKLLPAYNREKQEEIAMKFIKEKARSGRFWIGIFLSIIALFSSLGYIIKQMLK